MSIAYEFFKPESLNFNNSEELINFIIDNYGELMRVYRVMKEQNNATRSKKMAAHMSLEAVRNIEDTMDPKSLSEKAKLELSEKKKYFTKLREENDIIYYHGQPLERDQLTLLILKHPIIMQILERLDSLGRTAMAKMSHSVLSFIIKPFVKSAKYIQNDTDNQTMKMFAQHMEDVYESLPDIFEESFMESMEVDLSSHQPDDNDTDGGKGITFSFQF